MFTRLNRPGPWRGLTAAVLSLLRPGAAAAFRAGCAHPVHRPLCADRPGDGPWYHTRLWLVCPACRAVVEHRGFLPVPDDLDALAAPANGSPPAYAAGPGSPAGVAVFDSFSYDSAGAQADALSYDSSFVDLATCLRRGDVLPSGRRHQSMSRPSPASCALA